VALCPYSFPWSSDTVGGRTGICLASPNRIRMSSTYNTVSVNHGYRMYLVNNYKLKYVFVSNDIIFSRTQLPHLIDNITVPSGNTVTIRSSVISSTVSECFSLVMYTFGIHIRSNTPFWHTTSEESIGAKLSNASRTSFHRNCNSIRTLKSY